MITPSRIYQWCNAALLAVFFLSAFGHNVNTPGTMAACCLLFGFLAGIQCAGKKGYAALFLFFAGTGLFLLFSAQADTFLVFFRSFFLWLFQKKESLEGQTFYFELFDSLLLTAAAFLGQGLLEHFGKAKPAAALSLIVFLGFCLRNNSELSKAGTVCAFCYLLLVAVECTQIRWHREQKHSVSHHMVWLLPFPAVCLILLLSLPFPDKPYDWHWVRQAYENIRESVITLTWSLPFRKQEGYAPSYSGFSRDANLPGSVAKKTEELMMLETKNRMYTNLYLVGDTYDHFTGRQWEQTDTPPAFGRLLDPLLMANTCKTLQDAYPTDYMLRTTLSVRYLKFRTSYLFAPSKTLLITQNNRAMDMSREERWHFSDLQSYGTQYEADFYQLNTGQERFWTFLESADAPSDAEWEKILLEYKRIHSQDLAREDVSGYEAALQNIYGQPPALSASVYNWLETVTQGCETDVQRLLALEEALSEYAYRLSPGDLPKSVSDASSFLEYFLLESREGYCAHFASAFVLLARSMGLPARYVQGYLVPTKGKTQTIVTSDMAHAWPEVWLSGIGWITFEPTPGYAATGHASWQMRQPSAPSPSESSVPSARQAAPEISPAQDPAQPDDEGPSRAEAAESAAVWRILRRLPLFLPPALLLTTAVRYLERYLLRRRYRRLSCREQLRALAQYGMRCLLALQCRRLESETLQEFSCRAQKQLADDAPFALFSRYEKLLYGTGEFDRTDVAAARDAVNALLETLRTKNRFRYMRLWLAKPF